MMISGLTVNYLVVGPARGQSAASAAAATTTAAVAEQ